MNTSLSLVVIRASNLQNALAFYRALGLTFVEEQHGAGPLHYSCDVNGLVLEIYPAKAGASDEVDSTMLGFTVASLEGTLAALQALNVEPKALPKAAPWGRWVNVFDPDGRTVQLTQVM